MQEENIKDSHGGELKCQLTPKAEKEIEAIAPLLSESLADDIRCFIGCLRPELQDNEARSLEGATEAVHTPSPRWGTPPTLGGEQVTPLH